MDRAPTSETEAALRRLGAEPLGPHGGGALKVKVPLRRQSLEAVSRLPGARALAYATAEQKVAPDLSGAFARLGAEVSRFPLIVNLFEDDRGGAFADRIRATGAEVGRYDPGLRSYEVLASAEQARAVAGLDFVLFIEAVRRSGPDTTRACRPTAWTTSAPPASSVRAPCSASWTRASWSAARRPPCTTT
jgi:hypothetical protein